MLFSWRRPQLLGLLGIFLYSGHTAMAIELDLSNTKSIKNAAGTVAHNLMTFYKGNESGMAQGLLPPPYYWWLAGAMFGQMVEYWFYTGDETYNKVVTQGILAQVGPKNNFMPPNQTKTEGNDDQAFWAFAALSAAEMKYPDPPADQPSWLSLAQATFTLQAKRWDTEHCGGGLRWQIYSFNKGYDYKNSISNGGFFQLAARLARYTGNATYAEWADKTWDWMHTTPLFTENYAIYDGIKIVNCSNPSPIQWTYNVGVFLMGAANMYNYTNGDPKWQTRVQKLLDATDLFFPEQYGGDIMVEVACEPQLTCNNDQPSFKAYLARWMAATAQVAPFTEKKIMKKLRASAIGAAKQCSGGPLGRTCGRKWTDAVWDGKTGVGEEMSALSVIQANLIQKVAAPLTANTGGVSKSDPDAGTEGDNPILDKSVTRKITIGDRAGASILTAVTLGGLLATINAWLLYQTESPLLALVYSTSAAFLSFRQASLPRISPNPSALFPEGNKVNTFITSLQKKRKLSRQDNLERQLPSPLSTFDGSSSPVSPPSQSTCPARHPPLPDPALGLISSRSPPPSIPPHMVLEGAGKGRSPTPEHASTAASSPSAAYASLTLDSEGSGDTSTQDERRVILAADAPKLRTIKSRADLINRPSSPAIKRPASDMEEPSVEVQKGDAITGSDMPLEAMGSTGGSTPDSFHDLPDNPIPYAMESKEARLANEVTPSVEFGSISRVASSTTGPIAHGPFANSQSGPSSDASTGIQDPFPASSASSVASYDVPSIDEQINQVMMLASRPNHEGQKGFVISQKWLSRVLSRGSSPGGGEKYGKEAREGEIGPVDNTGINLVLDGSAGNLVDEAGEPYISLKPGVQYPEDFEILPQEAWNLIIKWYGLAKGSAIITRYCHNTSTSETTDNLQFELQPPIFTVLKLPDRSQGLTTKALKESNATPIRVLASRHEPYQSFLKRVKTLAHIELKTKVRVWRILGGLGAGNQADIMTPAQSRSNSPAPNFVAPVDPGNRLVLDVHCFAELHLGSQRELIETKDETANEKYNGHATLDIVGLRQDEVIVLEEQIGGPAGGEWVSDTCNRQLKSNGVAVSVTKSGATVVQDTLKPKAMTSSGRTSPAPGGMMTRGRQQRNGRTRGTTGLNNLGNTCYMNSALQCIRSVEELTQYFLQDKYKKDLNPNNPLSHNGMVAKAYALLLNDLFNHSAISSFAPRNFKNVIGKYGPSFSGYQQQDSQEFLLFLLDGLQEDLSRIHKKPYIEKPDSTDDMVNNPVALRAMADKCWDIYQARNDSVITDLFAGMYKSTVVCPKCAKVSIIFDPFNNLTLQLPIENVWSKEIYFFPLHSRPIKIGVDIDKNASFFALKEFVAGKVGVDPKKTIVAEIYKCRFYKMFDDGKSIGEERIADGDIIAVFEIEAEPSNYPPPKKKGQKQMQYYHNSDEEEDVPEGESPLADSMLVPVFNRHLKDCNPRFQQRTVFGVPSYIIITRDEANDYDAILRKVLAKVATMTTKGILNEEGESMNDSGPEDFDTVLMNADDEDSSSDSRVQAISIQSEDGVIDISMRDDGERVPKSSSLTDHSPPPKKQALPRMLRPGEFIAPEARILFDMKYFTSNEMIPTGWSTLQDENKDYPSISSRCENQEAQRRRSLKGKTARRIQRLGSASSSEAETEDVDVRDQAPALQNGYDSDSDGLPEVEQVTRAPASFATINRKLRRNSKSLITYGRKGKHVASNMNHDESETDLQRGSLIRLGEAIVLDWTAEAYDALFSGYETPEDNEMRGAPTWDVIHLMPDPELEEKRKIRIDRKRNGISLEDCLDEFGKPEVLSENDAWYCPRCKEHRRASKTFELWKAPDILVIHLKRFSAQGRNLRDKLDVLVDFPVEGLDLSSRVAMQEEGESLIYDLFAVDNHYGGLGGGHYTAFAQNFNDKFWYEYNDSMVSRRQNPQVVVTAAAYLLFYRRRASYPLGGPFFEQLVNVASQPSSQSQPTSRTSSPAGEGKRLDGFSLNGSSSALTGVGVIHQLGDGGSAAAGTAPRRTGVDDELPAYSENDGDALVHSTLESMEVDDVDEGIADMSGCFNLAQGTHQRWSFSGLSNLGDDTQGIIHRVAAPPASEGDDEDLFDDDSNKANSPSDDGRRLADFADDEGTTSGAFGPYGPDSSPLQDTPPPLEGFDEEPAVAEVRLTDGEDMTKVD